VLTFQVNLPQPCNMDAALDNWVRLHCFFFQLPWQWQPTSRLTEISGPSSTESRKNRRSAIGDLLQNSSNDWQKNFSSSSSSSSVSYIHNSRLLMMMRIPPLVVLIWSVFRVSDVLCPAHLICWTCALILLTHFFFFLNCRWWPKEAVVLDC
jgi:hypothetical protein